MISGISNFFRRYVGKSDDYTMMDSMSESPGLAVGAGVGAALGTVAGTALGLSRMSQDQVSVVTDRVEFTHPALVGAKYIPEDCTTNFTYDDKGNISGSYQTCDDPYFRPLIKEQPTGLVQERQRFQHTQWLGPVSGALIGLGTGLVLGAIVGGLANCLPAVSDSQSRQGKGNLAPLVGVAAGGTLGGLVGLHAGHLSEAHTQTLTQTVRTPVTTNQHIGWVPRAGDVHELRPQFDSQRQIFYQTQPGGSEPFAGKRDVVRAVPTGEFSSNVETSKSYHLTGTSGALIGIGVGAVAGGLAGVAVGVLQKHLAS